VKGYAGIWGENASGRKIKGPEARILLVVVDKE
jgi:hypothetical protein